ncbi:hypothetical protein [Flavisphingomonas formosensis]|uniref:hypothetical protein n=1 Tax=Flavisphingomonas formosensis TaxID=861534 RepID=UPI0012F79D45|nr:hypothetical protein [Sphingomonas formosensis]
MQSIYSEASFDWKRVRGRDTSVEFLTGLRREIGAYRGGRTLESHERSAGGNGFVTLVHEADYERGRGKELFLWRINGQQPQLARYRITIGGVAHEWPTPAPRPLANSPLPF